MKGRTSALLLAFLCMLGTGCYQLAQHYDITIETLPEQLGLVSQIPLEVYVSRAKWELLIVYNRGAALFDKHVLQRLNDILSAGTGPIDEIEMENALPDDNDPMSWLDDDLWTPDIEETEPINKDIIVAEPFGQINATDLVLALMGDEVNDVELDVLLRREFEAWSRAISHKLQSSCSALHEENQQLIAQMTEEYNVSLTADTRVSLVRIEELLIDLAADVGHIDCTSEINRVTNEIIYYDANRNELTHYITRPYLRKQFEKVNNHLKQFRAESLHNLEALQELVRRELRSQKELFIEIYEEWGDVMVTEWSKRIAYADINSPTDGHVFQMDKWGHFVRLKQSVLRLRDTLIEQPISTELLEEFLHESSHRTHNTVDMYNQRIAQLLRDASANFELRDSREVEESDSLEHLINKELDEGTAGSI